jgi:purine-binding chemotaxis protein CheW
MPQVVCFTVGPFRCALDVMRVREVVPARTVSPLPGAGPLVEGVVELRGTLLPVIDLRRRLAAPALVAAGKYLVVAIGGTRVALAVDGADDVRRLDPAAIQPPPALGDGAVAGVVHQDGQVLLILDADRLLDAAELARNLPA